MSDYEKLKKLIADADAMIPEDVSSGEPKVEAWEHSVRRFLLSHFGEKSLEYRKHFDISFEGAWDPYLTEAQNTAVDIQACREGLMRERTILATYLEEMEEDQEKAPREYHKVPTDMSKIFVVHGHDGELKEAVARIVEKQGINATILSEKANQGRTIIEKFENYSDVGGAICLFTADDIGKEKTGADEKPRARQNVVFEAGYFMGKLGRDHIVILADKGVEMPSDLSGVVYTHTANWQFELLKELKAMGYNVNSNLML